MTEPTRYYRTPMGIVHGHDPKCCASTNPAPCTPVVVLDPSDDAAVERLADTLAEDYPGDDRAFARHILTALLPPEAVTVETFGPGDVVRSKSTRRVCTVAENGFYDHADRRVVESTLPFTSEHYERVDGDA